MTNEEFLEQRVAYLAVELNQVLEHRADLSLAARNALLAVTADAAGILERELNDALARSQASGPEKTGP